MNAGFYTAEIAQFSPKCFACRRLPGAKMRIKCAFKPSAQNVQSDRKEEDSNSCVLQLVENNMELRTSILTFLGNRQGATAIEYSLICALIAVALIAILTATGQRASGVFGEISSAIR